MADDYPNSRLRTAREACASPATPGEPMSRAELAEAVNQHLWHTTGKRNALDSHTIARYERGQIRWPNAAYRTGLRAVLGVQRDADLGFQPTRRGSATARAARQIEGWQHDFGNSGGREALDALPTGVSSGLPDVAEALTIIGMEGSDRFDGVVDGLEVLVAHYSRLVTTRSSRRFYEELISVRRQAGAIAGRFGQRSRRKADLVVAVGWLSNLLAVTASYRGDHAAALVWCRDAERRSKDAGHPDLAGWAALSRAAIAYYQGHAHHSAAVARRGRHIAPIGTAVRAKLIAQEMRAAALLGSSERMERSRRQAMDAIHALPNQGRSWGVFSLAPTEDPPYTATSLLLVEQFEKAAAAANTVLRVAYPDAAEHRGRKSSNYARTVLILALAEVGCGRAEEAAVVGRAALDSAEPVWPTLVLAGRLDRQFTGRFPGTAEVADYQARFRDVVRRARDQASPRPNPGSGL